MALQVSFLGRFFNQSSRNLALDLRQECPQERQGLLSPHPLPI